MQTIINVISGKGGTGKTLLSAVLAEMLSNVGKRVLVVDLDVFVRGLTALLYFHKNETLKIVNSDELSVSDFFKHKGVRLIDRRISISRYRAFDVIPSVSSVDEILDFKDIMPNSKEEALDILDDLLKHIPNEYEFIFLDSRAGYDELIAATHEVSDFSICVEEDNNISMITSNNLIAQLKNESNKPILTIRNKAKKYTQNDSSSGIGFVGSIPFDTDVMNSFGTHIFWSDIEKSLYKMALINAWNSLAKKIGIDIILKSNRVSPVGSQSMEHRLSKLSSLNRIYFVYGLVITVLSFIITIGGSDFFYKIIYDPIKLTGLVMTILGICFTCISVFRK